MAAGGGPPSPFPSAAPNAPIKRPLIHFALPLPPSRRHVAASATTSQHLGELHAMLYGRHLLEWGLFFPPPHPSRMTPSASEAPARRGAAGWRLVVSHRAARNSAAFVIWSHSARMRDFTWMRCGVKGDIWNCVAPFRFLRGRSS